MMTEATPPQEMGPAPETAPAQSQGHRRRRRRRKNKSQQAAAAQGGAPQGQIQAPPPGQPQQQSPPPPPRPVPVQQHQQRPHQQHQNQGQGRKKKKFFEKRQQQQAQPGNSINGSQGKQQRRGRQKGPREFVGPMDHSYRSVNGNVADAPPSTIQMPNNHHGNYYSDTSRVGNVRADAPTRIFCFIEDLFFLAKIQETARKLGVKVEFLKGSEKETVAHLLDLPENERPNLVVFDLNNLNAKPMTLIPKIKTKFKKSTSIIGFLSHLQGDLKMKATEAGCDTVMPRSAFSQSLPNLLRRYGVEEEEEDHMPQPV
jgi:hypothetical protein